MNLTTKVKLVAAVIGTGAAVTTGALSMAMSADQAAPALMATSNMNIGATVTQTTPPHAPAVSMAVPQIKGPAPLPSEQAQAKG